MQRYEEELKEHDEELREHDTLGVHDVSDKELDHNDDTPTVELASGLSGVAKDVLTWIRLVTYSIHYSTKCENSCSLSGIRKIYFDIIDYCIRQSCGSRLGSEPINSL